ncbi:MAG: hypothetical protein V3R99_01435, partial [Thermoguttaceae bacterium]
MDSSTKTSTATRIGSPKSIARMAGFGKHGTTCFFLALFAVIALNTPNFLSIGTAENTLVQVFPVMLVALGMTLVISSGGIDISVGAIMAISAAVSARLYTSGVGLVP